MRKVLFVAGEASGDLHAAGVAGALRRVRPELGLAGVGGARLAEQGVELIHRDNQLGVMGFLEVLKHVPRHFLLLRTIRKMLDRNEIAVVVLVDYPGFNMKVAAAAKRAGVPVLYYVTPQVWAWGAGRIPKLAQLISKAAVILPFEEPLLRGYGIDATFVGHPLLDRAVNMPASRKSIATSRTSWRRRKSCSAGLQACKSLSASRRPLLSTRIAALFGLSTRRH